MPELQIAGNWVSVLGKLSLPVGPFLVPLIQAVFEKGCKLMYPCSDLL